MFNRLLIAAALTVTAASAGAQSTKYYLQTGDQSTGYIVQNGLLLSTYSLGDGDQYPLAFTTSATFLSAYRDGSGVVERDLNGTPTGNTFSHAQNVDQGLDGGWDGTHTYVARCCSGGDGIYQGDADFGNLVQISGAGSESVTYNSQSGTLFATSFGGLLFEMTTTGTILNTYSIENTRALAYEALTNTLWTTNGGSTIYQYSTTGELLQSIDIDGLGGNIFGGEMPVDYNVTPEPATLALFAPGMLAAFAVARRRRRSVVSKS